MTSQQLHFGRELLEQLAVFLAPVSELSIDGGIPALLRTIAASTTLNEAIREGLDDSIVSAQQFIEPLVDLAVQVRSLEVQNPSASSVLRLMENVSDIVRQIVRLVQDPPIVHGLPLEAIPELLAACLLYLSHHYLERSAPRLLALLSFLGILKSEFVNGVLRYSVHWERLEYITRPDQLIVNEYGWGSETPRLLEFLERLNDVLQRMELFSSLHEESESDVRSLRIGLGPIQEDESFPIILSLQILPPLATNRRSTGIELRVAQSSTGDSGIAIQFRPQLPDVFAGELPTFRMVLSDFLPNQPLSINVGDATTFLRSSGPFFVTRRGAQGYQIGVGVDDFTTSVNLDSLGAPWSSFFRDATLRHSFAFCVVWNATTREVTFDGSSGFSLDLPTRIQLGPLAFHTLQIRLSAGSTQASFRIGTSGSAQLGPVLASFSEFGLAAGIRLDGHPKTPTLGFSPPTLLRLSVQVPSVTGSGLLEWQPDCGRYVGALRLQAVQLALAATVLLDTRGLPEGAPFSLIAALVLQFPGIPLGMGFFLRGVGGFVGVHRRICFQLLAASVRRGTSRQLLFLGDSTQLLTESIVPIGEVFPAAVSRHFFGPAVQLDYGPPGTPFASVSAVLLLELPSPLRFALLGQVDAFLPSRQASVIELHADFLGVLDLGEHYVSIDASLNNSRIGPLTLFGDLAFRLGWGEQPYFLLSIGGFNPHFQAPSNFPTLRRLTLGYTAPNGLVRLRIESYFAITSNTLQLGARIEVQVRVEIATIDGALAFDALVNFSPFSFQIDFLASLSVSVFGTKLLAIHLEGTVKGPKPWHITGKARLSVLFIETTVDVDVKFGGEPSLEELPSVDPTDRLLEALRAPASWKGELMPGVSRPVSLSDATNSETPLFDPVGVPAVRQTIVPLNRKLDRFAEGRIGGPGRYDVRAARVGTAPATQRPAHELFAAAQFEQMSDAEKLSRPSFEKMDAGALLASDAISVGPKSQGAGLFEQIKLGAEETPTTATLPSEQILASSRSGASSLRGLRVQGSDRFAPPPGSAPRIALADELYVAVRRDSLRPSERATPETAGAASALVQWLKEESGGASLFQVAPAFEATGGESR